MAKYDPEQPFAKYLKTRGITFSAAARDLGRAPATVTRWILRQRTPGARDQQAIENYTRGGVPVSVWHAEALKRSAA